MPDMKLGVLSDMPGIRKRACLKLFKRQVLLIFVLLSLFFNFCGNWIF